LAGVGIAAAAAVPAWGQARYPSKPVKLIVPFPPGQASDIYGRMLAQRLSVMWGQPVIVENRAGGVGVPAMLAGKAAPADGYTLVMASVGTLSINPVLHPDLPYSPAQDFVPVSNVVLQPLVLIANPSFPARSVADLVALAKRSVDPIQFASPGHGTSQHLTVELLAARAGIQLQHVPYKGSAPALIDLLGGGVPLMMDSVTSALPQIKAGKIRPIAVATARRIPQLPEAPTVAESGYPGFGGAGWTGLVLPSRTPRDLVERISADVQRVLNDPHMQREILEKGAIADPRAPQGYAEFIRAETEKWAKVANDAHIRAED
jgi:tripartite-type tricarboxylate transporter receptor subunit TctC